MTSFRTLIEGLSPRRLSIRQTLVAATLLMALGGPVLALVLLDAERRVDAANSRLASRARLAESVERANLALLDARRDERDFLLRLQEFGIAEARSRYVPLFNLRMDDFDQALAEIRRADGGEAIAEATGNIDRISQTYRTAFLRMVELATRRGSFDAGLFSEMRRKGDEIEGLLGQPGNEALLAELLRMRRAKVDYILSGSLQYAIAFRDAGQKVAAHLGRANLAERRRQELLGALGQFSSYFEQYVALSEAISADIVRFRGAASGIQPLLDDIRVRTRREREAVRAEVREVDRASHRIVMGLVFFGLVVVGFAAHILYRKVSSMIAKVEAFSARIGEGDFSARFETASGGEKRRLAIALNLMADELRRSHDAIRAQADELEAAARMKAALLNSVSHEVKTPLNAMVGYAELLETGAAGPLEPRQRECVDQIRDSGIQLARLIDRIVEATQLDSRAEPGTSPAPRAAPVEREDAAGGRVLIVDDHPVNLAILARQVVSMGHDCDVADDGAAAFVKWQSGRYGIVVTDCNMPGMDGYELARRIRADESARGLPRTRIVACTANLVAGEAEKCRAAGMDDYLAKPVELHALREKLDPRRRAGAPVEGEAPPTASPVDPSVLAEISGGDAGLERDLIREFLKVNAEDVALFGQAVKARDGGALVHAAHRMKGAGRTMGAGDFAEVCGELEAAGRSGDWEGVTQRIARFDAELRRLNRHFGSVADP